MIRKKLGKKCLLRTIENQQQHIAFIESCTDKLIDSMLEDIWTTKGREKTKLRNKYFKQLVILFGFDTEEEFKELQDMLKSKPGKDNEAETKK